MAMFNSFLYVYQRVAQFLKIRKSSNPHDWRPDETGRSFRSRSPEAIGWITTRENKALTGPGQWPKTSSARFKEWETWPQISQVASMEIMDYYMDYYMD